MPSEIAFLHGVRDRLPSEIAFALPVLTATVYMYVHSTVNKLTQDQFRSISREASPRWDGGDFAVTAAPRAVGNFAQFNETRRCAMPKCHTTMEDDYNVHVL